jgi:23S rRNA (cytidine2498-2'-O)-methyltransferase
MSVAEPADRAIITADPDSEGPAMEELSRALFAPSSERPIARRPKALRREGSERSPLADMRLHPRRLGPGIFLVSPPGTFEAFAAALRRTPPIFIRHVQPVHREILIAGRMADVDLLAATAVALAPRLTAEQSFSVQTRLLPDGHASGHEGSHPGFPFARFDLNERLSEALAEASEAPLDVRQPDRVLSVLVTRETGFLGVSRVQDNLSSWAGGAIRFAREPGQVSRSEFKLLEALQVFGLELPSSGRALDLGASPGGWTRLLRRSGLQVSAVDPGDLDSRLAGDPGIRHVRVLAQEYRCGHGEFDVIVNDMRMDARDSARLMLGFAPCLSSSGWIVMTLKLPQHMPAQTAHQAMELLLRRYRLLGARQLYHNRSEITVALTRGDEK